MRLVLVKQKPKVENPDIAKIKASFKFNYKAIRVGYGDVRFVDVDEFLAFASVHEIQDLYYMEYCSNIDFFYAYNGLTYEIQLKTMVDS